jgi:hypothetical protein
MRTMTAVCWNILGLILSLVGVLLLFRYGMPYRVRTGGARVRTLQGTDEATRQEERRYNLLGWLGVALIVLGTISQIMANLSH